MTMADLRHYLHTTEADLLDPLLLDNIQEGALMLLESLYKNEKITIIVDSDFDGFASSAFLLNYLHHLFPQSTEQIAYTLHTGKQHGIEPTRVPEDTKLLIVPDAGSDQPEEWAEMIGRGCKILILDHHESECETINGVIRINNHTCNYPNKGLCGTGVVYKFCSYIDKLNNSNYAKGLLDLVATAEVADVMELTDYETRYLVATGLSSINNPFLSSLCAKNAYSLGDEITPFGIGFYVAPYVNAVIRSGTHKDKRLVFASMLDWLGWEEIPSTKRGRKPGDMEIRAEQAVRICVNAKKKQNDQQEQASQIADQIIKEKNLTENKILVVVLGKDDVVNPSLTGLISNTLMSKYKKPVLLLRDDGEGNYSGSGRNLPNSNFEDFKQFVNDSQLAEFAQGHASAYGTSFTKENLDKFIKYSNKKLKDFDFSGKYTVDAVLEAALLYPCDVYDIADYRSIYGQGISEPLFLIRNFRVHKDNVTLLSPDKKPTLKFTFPNGITAIKFKSSKEEFDELYSATGCVHIDFVGRFDRNFYNGNSTPQIVMEAYEITDRQQFYF